MMAAEPKPVERPAEAPRVRDEMHDDPEELAPGHPLQGALALCRALLAPCYDVAVARAVASARRRANLAFWAAAAGGLSVVLSVFQLAEAAAGKPLVTMARPLAFTEALAAIACFVLLGARAVGSGKRAWLVDRTRIERCRAAKFRYLLDPALWSRRGQEAEERTSQFRSEALSLTALGSEGVSEWIGADTIPVVRTIPVGSGIDPHTVHVLMDYYQSRRIDPQLARLAADASHGRGPSGMAISGLFFSASVVCILVQAALGLARAVGPGLVVTLIAVAASLPFAGAIVTAGLLRSASDSARRRAASRHRALADLSQRLQKVSGAEAIFREMGFCEDVLEAEGRERLRIDLETV
jgi:hypothetical protein